MKLLKKKGLYYYLLLVAAVLAVVTLILGATQHAMKTDMNFSVPLMVFLAVGVVLVVVNLFVDLDFLPLVVSVCIFIGFGMIVNEGLPVVVDKINNISFQGGVFEAVAAYLAMMAVSSVLCIVSCFIKKKEA